MKESLIILTTLFAIASDVRCTYPQKILNGYPITIDKAPYQVWVALYAVNEAKFGDGLICGGTVISQRAVLSAARCFHTAELTPDEILHRQYVIVAGGNFIDKPDENTQQYTMEKLVMHPDFNQDPIINDIALIFLDGFIPYNSPTVKAVVLAERPPAIGEVCLTSGWGKIGEEEWTTTLMQAQVSVMNDEKCLQEYPEDPLSLILTYPIKSALADTGGPLICSNRLSGVVSSAMFCGAPYDEVEIFTNVSYYLDWIRGVNSSFDYSMYSCNLAFDIQRSINLRNICFIVLYTFLLWA